MNCELNRYLFILKRDGKDKAFSWLEDLIKTYRKVVLDRTKMTMKRRELICGYVCAKRLIQGLLLTKEELLRRKELIKNELL